MLVEHLNQMQAFLDAATADPVLRWYAIADSAQASSLPQAVHRPNYYWIRDKWMR